MTKCPTCGHEIEKDWLTTAEAADYLRYGDPSALWKLSKRTGIAPDGKRGRIALWSRDTLDSMIKALPSRVDTKDPFGLRAALKMVPRKGRT